MLLKYHTPGYFRYMDDILIVYKNEVMNIQEVLDSFNNITPTMTFIMEEVNNRYQLPRYSPKLIIRSRLTCTETNCN